MKVHRLSNCTWNLFQRSIEWHRHKNLFGAKCLRISFGIIKSIYIQSILCYRWLKVLISFSLKSSVDFLVVLVEICGVRLLAITQHQLPFPISFFFVRVVKFVITNSFLIKIARISFTSQTMRCSHLFFVFMIGTGLYLPYLTNIENAVSKCRMIIWRTVKSRFCVSWVLCRAKGKEF